MRKLFAVMLMMICLSCLPVEEEDDAQVRQWSMSGKADFTGGDATSDVMLGLFYIAGTAMPASVTTSHTLVSNAVSLGNKPSSDIMFTLRVDCTKTKPSDGQYLMMFMWRDTDGSGTYSSGETCSQVMCPVGSGSASFIGDSTADVVCHYIYEAEYDTALGTTKGWNQISGYKYKNVKSLAVRRSGEYYLPDASVKAKSGL